MTMQIKSVILYNHDGEIRELPFRTGAVNIITGRSLTGKSALIDIIDYCLGRSSFTVPEGVIRDTVAWYGVIFDFRNGTEVLVAKPAPDQNAASQSQAHLRFGNNLTPPPLAELSPNTNDAGVISELSARIGIRANLHVPPPGQSRDALEATIRHAIYYLFQPQGIIASRDVLFYRQLEPFIPQTIKDTLPYFLGIVNPEGLATEHDLRLARRRLKLAYRDLQEAEAISADQLTRANGLIVEAQQVGLVPGGVAYDTSESVLSALRNIAEWKPTVPPGPEADKIAEMRHSVDESRENFKRLQQQIRAAEVFERDSRAYASEAGQQALRLQSINAFEDQNTAHRCPVCSTELLDEVPTAEAINASLEQLQKDLRQVEAETPRLREYIDGLKRRREELREQVVQAEFALEATVVQGEAAEQYRMAVARAARVVGRVSLYLESMRAVTDDASLQKAVHDAEAEVERLENVLGSDEDDLLMSALNVIATDMTHWAEDLELEHEGPYRLDLVNVTVAIDRPGKPVSMQRIGGGKNYLGCHLIALLALHKFFVNAGSAVPGFLVLDQPTQVYFVSPQRYKDIAGTTDETLEADADLDAVRRLFQLVWQVCEAADGNLQVIVLEHANLPEERYQSGLVEEPWNGFGTHALVPEAWKSARTNGTSQEH